MTIRIERRLDQPRWLGVAVPVGSIVLAFGVMALVLLATGHAPGHTFSRLLVNGFGSSGALTNTFTSATPLAFTGLAAAVAFRMQLFNIGGEGQLYFGTIGAAAAALALGNTSSLVLVTAMIGAGALCGALWAAIPGVLRAFFKTNEIITSLMLNYVAALIITYLIFDSHSYWRASAGFEASVFPQGKDLPTHSNWWTFGTQTVVPFGFVLAVAVAALVWVLYQRTRFGFEVKVIGDSWRAARYAGMRTGRKIVAVMMLSGAIAGIGGASQDGDFRHLLDPKGLTAAGYGYTGIVVAALARYNPFMTVVVAFLIGGLQNAGYALQGADFPAGLVGVMQGLILFCALGGEILTRYRIRIARASRLGEPAGRPEVVS